MSCSPFDVLLSAVRERGLSLSSLGAADVLTLDEARRAALALGLPVPASSLAPIICQLSECEAIERDDAPALLSLLELAASLP